MTTTKQEDASGFSIGGERYIETRFNLLTVAIEKLELTIRERISSSEQLRQALEKSVNERFIHLEQINQIIQESAKRAVDKAEEQQHAVNVAQNEWRSTFNDYKNTTASSTELEQLRVSLVAAAEQLRNDFAAYRLEQSRVNAQAAGAKEAKTETKDDNKSLWGIVAGVLALGLTVAGLYMNNGNGKQSPLYSVPPGYKLTPDSK